MSTLYTSAKKGILEEELLLCINSLKKKKKIQSGLYLFAVVIVHTPQDCAPYLLFSAITLCPMFILYILIILYTVFSLLLLYSILFYSILFYSILFYS